MLFIFLKTMFRAKQIVGLVVLLAVAAHAQHFAATHAQMDALFSSAFSNAQMNASGIVAAAVAVVRADGTIVYQQGFGSQNLLGARTTSYNSVFRLASVSKLIAGAVGCYAIDQGVDVNADMNVYTQRNSPPVTVQDYLVGNYTAYASHPVYPTTQPMTLFNALTQTCGMDSAGQQGTINQANIAGRIPLADYYACCAPKRIRPASDVITYSNHGIGYIGVVAQGATGQSYESLVQQQIFNKLNMTNSYPVLTQGVLDLPNLQQFMKFSPVYNLSGPYPIDGLEPSPAGDSFSTAEDMAKFMAMWLNNGTYAPTGQRVLSPEVVQQAIKTQFRSHPLLPGLGYVWWMGSQNSLDFIEHDGNLAGFNNRMRLYPEQGVGLVILTNSATAGFAIVARVANDFQNTFITPFGCNGTGQVYLPTLGCVSGWQQVPGAIGPQLTAATRYAGMTGEWAKYRFSRLTWLRFGGYFTNRIQVYPSNGFLMVDSECWVERSDGSFYAGYPFDTTCIFVIPFDESWVRAVRWGNDGRAAYLLSQTAVIEYMPVGWNLNWLAIFGLFAAIFVLDSIIAIPVQIGTFIRWNNSEASEKMADLGISLNPLYTGKGSSAQESNGSGNKLALFLHLMHLLCRLITNVFYLVNAVVPLLTLSNAPGVGFGDPIRTVLNLSIAAIVFLFTALLLHIATVFKSDKPVPKVHTILSIIIAVVQFLWIFCLAEWNWLGGYWDPQP